MFPRYARGHVRMRTHHVLFLGSQLVPASVLASALDFGGVETLCDIRVQPVGRSSEVARLLAGSLAAALPPGLLLVLFLIFLTSLGVRIPVGVNVLDQAGLRKLAGHDSGEKREYEEKMPR